MPRFSILQKIFSGILCATALVASARAESLFELYQKALESNPTLLRREGESQQAEAQARIVRSALLPQLVAQKSVTPTIIYRDKLTNVTQHYDGQRSSIQLSQSILDLSAWYRFASEKRREAQTKELVLAARMMLGGELLSHYLEALQASDELSRIDAETEAVSGQLKRVKFMHERQMAKVTDLLEVASYLRRLETQRLEANSARDIAFEYLSQLTGMSVTALPPLGERVPKLEGDLEVWLSLAAEKNPILISLRHAIEGAGMAVKSAKSKYAPVISMAASRVYSDQGYDSRQQPAYRVDTLGFQMTMPFFEGGKTMAEVDESRARQQVALSQYEEARRELVRQVKSDYLLALSSFSKIDSTSQEIAAREKILDAQEKGYKVGIATVVDLLDARKQLLKARAEHAKARYDFLNGTMSLRVRSGVMDDSAMDEYSQIFDSKKP